jgi:hypothetical protein
MIAAIAFVGVAVVFTALVLVAYALYLAQGGLSRRRASSNTHRQIQSELIRTALEKAS